jgi:acyl-CoA reductase-like NAD-dependent aldehyde dehydrogenase
MVSTEIIDQEIDAVMQKAWSAFRIYKKYPLKEKKDFLYAIADELENAGDDLIKTCMEETMQTIATAEPGLMPGSIPQSPTAHPLSRISGK